MFLHNRLTSGDVTGRRTWQFPAVHVTKKAEYSHTTNGGLIFQASPVFPANLLHCDNGNRGQERLSSFGEDQDEVKTRVTQT